MTILAEVPSRYMLSSADKKITTTIQSVADAQPGESFLVLKQPELGRDSLTDDDRIILDRNAQHALYLILKNRFEA